MSRFQKSIFIGGILLSLFCGPAMAQSDLAARWEPGVPGPPAGAGFLETGPRVGKRSDSLEVVTTNLLPGYLRNNGIPYSARTTVTE